MDRYTYKAKRIDNNEWIYGDLIKTSIIDPFTYISKGAGYKITDKEIGKPVKIFPNTVCQCTGLQDVEGNYIFENDKVEIKNTDDDETWEDIVIWHDSYPAFDLLETDNEYNNLTYDNYEFKIIGNKFNKEIINNGK